MECKEARPLLGESLTGAAPRWPLAHLSACPECSRRLEELRSVERRLLELPAVLPAFAEGDLGLSVRPPPARGARTAALLAAAAAILMTLTLLLRAPAPPETGPAALARRAEGLVEEMARSEGDRREALVLEILNLGPEARPLLERLVGKAPEIPDLVLALQAAEEARVTVILKEGEILHGSLVTTAFKMKTSFGETTVQVAKVVSIEFGTTDVVTTREKTRLSGKILLETFKLKTEAGETALKRAALASLTVDGAAGKLEKGKIEDGTAKSGVTYHLRLPLKHDPKRAWPAILILHGSNMNSKLYVETIVQAWPALAEEYVLVGIDGEKKGPADKDGNAAFNYTYVNFAGKSKYKGFPGTDRESPALVAEALAEIKARVSVSKVFVGGHSQGAFLAYSLYMNYPEMFAGAFPVSGGLIIQAEPTAFDQEEIRRAQRRGALAVVHGENDQMVPFGSGKAALESFLEDGFPRVRLFSHPTAAHQFALLPVEEAVRWLDAMSAEDPAVLVLEAERRVAARQWRDALGLLDRARALVKGSTLASKVKDLQEAVEREAAPRAKAIEAAMTRAKDDSWVADFAAFRADFEFAEAALPVMRAFGTLRAAQEKPGEELWFAARKEFNSGRDAEGYRKCQELVEKYFASSYYRYAKLSLKDRK